LIQQKGKQVTKTIKCELYDHFEIACMRRSKVSLELHGGETVTGVANDLAAEEGKEFLLLITENGDRRVNLMHIDVLVFSGSPERISIL
jgi:transcriptional antiterminator Rof (Rho-off)